MDESQILKDNVIFLEDDMGVSNRLAEMLLAKCGLMAWPYATELAAFRLNADHEEVERVALSLLRQGRIHVHEIGNNQVEILIGDRFDDVVIDWPNPSIKVHAFADIQDRALTSTDELPTEQLVRAPLYDRTEPSRTGPAYFRLKSIDKEPPLTALARQRSFFLFDPYEIQGVVRASGLLTGEQRQASRGRRDYSERELLLLSAMTTRLAIKKEALKPGEWRGLLVKAEDTLNSRKATTKADEDTAAQSTLYNYAKYLLLFDQIARHPERASRNVAERKLPKLVEAIATELLALARVAAICGSDAATPEYAINAAMKWSATFWGLSPVDRELESITRRLVAAINKLHPNALASSIPNSRSGHLERRRIP